VNGAAVAGATAVMPAGALAHAHARRGRRAADLVVHNGSVLTMNRRFDVADAVAIRDGRVIATGDMRRLRGLVDRKTRTLDADGATVLPGINDSYLHLNGFGVSFPPYSFSVDTATIEELVAVVRDAVAQSQPNAWIRGRDWNDNRLPRAPTAKDLDPVSPNNPVALTDFSFHAIAVNSVVMRMAGITRDTQPPPGGVIEKDAAGEPTGVFRETAQGLVRSVIPPFSAQEISTSVDAGIKILHGLGITSVTEPGISLELLDMYASKQRDGKLPMRITALLSGGNSSDTMRTMLDAYRPIAGLDPLNLPVAGMKIFGDGIPTAAKTASLHEPYLDGSNGRLVIAGATEAEAVAMLSEMIDQAPPRRHAGRHARHRRCDDRRRRRGLPGGNGGDQATRSAPLRHPWRPHAARDPEEDGQERDRREHERDDQVPARVARSIPCWAPSAPITSGRIEPRSISASGCPARPMRR
jgi:predicted amidohydrolase YtcJ